MTTRTRNWEAALVAGASPPALDRGVGLGAPASTSPAAIGGRAARAGGLLDRG